MIDDDLRNIPNKPITDPRSGIKYEPLRKIGGGGSAIVFTARISGTDNIVLLKEFYPEEDCVRDADTDRIIPDPEIFFDGDGSDPHIKLRESFLKEREASEAVDSALYSIIPVIDSFISGSGNCYIVMKYEKHGVSLKSLRLWLNEQLNGNGGTDRFYISARAWINLFQRLCDITINMHRCGMIHADISPGNIMLLCDCPPGGNIYEELVRRIMSFGNAGDAVVYQYNAVLLDFGASYFGDEVITDGDMLKAYRREHVFSTEGFASPELTSKDYWDYDRNDRTKLRYVVTQFTDVYSLCACLRYCMGEIDSHSRFICAADDLKPTVSSLMQSMFERSIIQKKDLLEISREKAAQYENTKIQTTEELSVILAELITRIDGKGVSKAAIWEAARRVFNDKCTDQGRFAKLHIVEEILPLGNKADRISNDSHSLPIEARDGDDKAALPDLIEQHKGHNINIYGEGGIGKTTTLVRMAQKEYSADRYDPDRTVVIYIELNRCPADIGTYKKLGNHTDFIARHIRFMLDGTPYQNDPDDTLTKIKAEFSKKTDKPEYLLLLDGMNEASGKSAEGKPSARELLLDEVQDLLRDRNNVNVRAIITSRTEHRELAYNEKNLFVNLELTGITKETALEYIRKKGTQAHIDAVEHSSALMKILTIPLFLTIYVRVNPEGVETRGGLLKAFWHEKAASYYNEAGRREDLGKEGKFRLPPEAYTFMIYFIVPALCYEMEDNDKFSLSAREVTRIINSVLNDDGETGLLGEYGVECFREYFDNRSDSDISTIVSDLVAALGGGKIRSDGSIDFSPVSKKIAKELSDSVAVLYSNSDHSEYVIRHHHMRDYFTAVYWVNQLKLASEIFNSEHKEGQ